MVFVPSACLPWAIMRQSPASKTVPTAPKPDVGEITVSELFEIAQTLGLLPLDRIKESVTSHQAGRMLSAQLVTSVEDALKAAAHIYRRAAQIAKDSSQVDPYVKDEADKKAEEARKQVAKFWLNMNTEFDQISRATLKSYLGYESDEPFSSYLNRILFPSSSKTKFSRSQALVIKGLKALAKKECDTNRKATSRVKGKINVRTRRNGNPTSERKLIDDLWLQSALEGIRDDTDFEAGTLQAHFEKLFLGQNFSIPGHT